MSIQVLSTDEYEPQEFDAVLVRDSSVVCIDAAGDVLRVFPLDKVNHVDADPDMLIQGSAIPDSFYGGARYGIVEIDQFPDLERHLEDLDRKIV